MIDLKEQPEAILTAKHGDNFLLDGHTFVLEEGGHGHTYLTVISGIDNIELVPCSEGPYDWAHVRRTTDNLAVMLTEHLVAIIRDNQYRIA